MSQEMPFAHNQTHSARGPAGLLHGFGAAVLRGTLTAAHFFVTGATCVAIAILLI